MTHVSELMQKHLDRYKIKDENRRRSYEDGFHDGYFEGYMEAADKLMDLMKSVVGTSKKVISGSDPRVMKELMDPRNVETR